MEPSARVPFAYRGGPIRVITEQDLKDEQDRLHQSVKEFLDFWKAEALRNGAVVDHAGYVHAAVGCYGFNEATAEMYVEQWGGVLK
jgi:hypothetical protein